MIFATLINKIMLSKETLLMNMYKNSQKDILFNDFTFWFHFLALQWFLICSLLLC